MTTDERTLCDALIRSSKLETDEDIEAFVQAAQGLPITDDAEVLEVMLGCLNTSEAGDVQYELIEAIERFPNEAYAKAVLRHGRRLVSMAGRWGWMLVQTVLNTDACLRVAAAEFRALDDAEQGAFESVLNELCDRDVRYIERRRLFVRR